MWASSQGRVDTVAVLLEAGADVNAVDDDGERGRNRNQSVTFFKRSYIPFLIPSDTSHILSHPFSNTYHHILTHTSSHTSSHTHTLTHPTLTHPTGVSALMWASGSEVKDETNHKQGLLEKATKGQKEVVALLLKYGASPDMRDRDGR